MRTETVLDAIEMARWSRGPLHEQLRCHSDAGSQFTSIRYGERLAEIGAAPSIGTVGDSYDNALAETVNGYYRADPRSCAGSARSVEDGRGCGAGWRLWGGCIGATRTVCLATSVIGRRLSSRPYSTMTTPEPMGWWNPYSWSLHRSQCVSSAGSFDRQFWPLERSSCILVERLSTTSGRRPRGLSASRQRRAR